MKASALEILLFGKTEVTVKILPRRCLSKFLLEAEIKLILTIVFCRIKGAAHSTTPNLKSSCKGFINEVH